MTDSESGWVRVPEGQISHRCALCSKNAVTGMLQCGGCKLASYCSPECRRKHWEQHQVSCQALSSLRTFHKKNREFRLFRRWLDIAKESVNKYCYYIHKDQQFARRPHFDPAAFVFRFDVAFNFNLRTFVPVSPVEVVPLESLDQSLLTLATLHPTAPTIFVRFKSFQLPIAANPDVNYQICRCLEMDPERYKMMLFSSPRPSSSVFCKWSEEQRRNNFYKSLRPALGEKMDTLVLAALRLICQQSTKRRHKTHVVTFDCSLGLDFFQVKSLDECNILPVPEVCTKIRRYTGTETERTKMERELKSEEVFNEDQDCLRMHIVFFVKPTAHVFIFTNCLRISELQLMKRLPVHKCDRLAVDLFKELQSIPLAPVESPDLNDEFKEEEEVVPKTELEEID